MENSIEVCLDCKYFDECNLEPAVKQYGGYECEYKISVSNEVT